MLINLSKQKTSTISIGSLVVLQGYKIKLKQLTWNSLCTLICLTHVLNCLTDSSPIFNNEWMILSRLLEYPKMSSNLWDYLPLAYRDHQTRSMSWLYSSYIGFLSRSSTQCWYMWGDRQWKTVLWVGCNRLTWLVRTIISGFILLTLKRVIDGIRFTQDVMVSCLCSM